MRRTQEDSVFTWLQRHWTQPWTCCFRISFCLVRLIPCVNTIKLTSLNRRWICFFQMSCMRRIRTFLWLVTSLNMFLVLVCVGHDVAPSALLSSLSVCCWAVDGDVLVDLFSGSSFRHVDEWLSHLVQILCHMDVQLPAASANTELRRHIRCCRCLTSSSQRKLSHTFTYLEDLCLQQSIWNSFLRSWSLGLKYQAEVVALLVSFTFERYLVNPLKSSLVTLLHYFMKTVMCQGLYYTNSRLTSVMMFTDHLCFYSVKLRIHLPIRITVK